jgi:tRNA threonylcarbamoyladenosine biosynthesis protein TsaE
VIHAARLSTSEPETDQIGAALATLIRGGDILLLDGPLGAGKTTLVRAIALALNLPAAHIASPTFVLIHDYRRDTPATPATPDLIHADAYRLRGSEDLDSLGWDTVLDRLRNQTAAIIIEWAERLGGGAALPGAAAPAHITLDHAGEHERELSFQLPDSWRTRNGLAALLARQPTTCPVTGEPVPADSPSYPFSSDRARMADLHKWFSGAHRISREATAADFDDSQPEPS